MNAKVWLCIVLAMFWWADLNAQDSPVGQGTFMIDGSLRLASSWGDDFTAERSANFVFTPSVLYFPVSSFAIGGRINIENYKLYGYEVKRAFLGPQMGFYIRMGKKQNYIYSEFSFGFISMEFDNDREGVGVEYGVGLGFLNFVSKHIAVKGGVDFIKQSVDEINDIVFYPSFKVNHAYNGGDDLDGSITQFVVGLSYFIY
jgi:hypothetical protein